MTVQFGPRISILTPCLNRRDFVGRAIESVLAQKYTNFEHIIIDGGSTDGTLEIARAYPHLKVVSEPDQGMYDALNKGVEMANGDLIATLNSDDTYAPGALHAVAACFAANPGVEAILGDALIVDEQGCLTAEMLCNTRRPQFDFAAFETGFQINACFFTPQLYTSLGPYDTRYRIVGDLDLLLRMALDGALVVHVCDVLYYLHAHADSLTVNTDLSALERRLSEEIQLWQAWLGRDDLSTAGRQYCQERCGNACFTLAIWHASESEWHAALSRGWNGWCLAPRKMLSRVREWAQLRFERIGVSSTL